MATTSTTPEPPYTKAATSALLVSLASHASEGKEQLLANLSEALAGANAVVATPDTGAATATQTGSLRVVGYTPSAASPAGWTLAAADFVNAFELAQKYESKAILMLGAEAQTLSIAAIRSLTASVLEGKADLTVPRYTLPPRTGLVNSAILYPITRALFGAAPRFPLAIDLGLSLRMAGRMAAAAQRFTAANQPEALVWPVSEASVATCAITQVDVGSRTTPQPTGADLNSVLAQVTGSLFADVDAKAAFWQRSRVAHPSRAVADPAVAASSPEDIKPMLESFRLAYTNLQEIWSLVLPPQSLLGLKRLAVMPPETFAMPDSLWARVVYDFLLAYRLRTINRGHLLGALTPLYLAWVASHIRQTSAGPSMDTQAPERHIEAVAAAFEADKPYLVSRWRWPDRFNP